MARVRYFCIFAVWLCCLSPLYSSEDAQGAQTVKEKLTNELSTLETALISLQIQIDNYKRLIQDLNKEINNLNQRILNLEALQRQDEQSLSELKQALTELRALSENYKAQLAIQIQRFTELSNQYAELEKLLKDSHNNTLGVQIFTGIVTGILALGAGLAIGHLIK